MSNISSSLIQKLREESGAGVMDSKKALEEAGGDLVKAQEILRERGLQKMAKRADRSTGAGMIFSYIHGGRIGALLDLRAETDFVVRSEPFQKLAQEIVMQIAAAGPENVEELLTQPYIRDEKRVIKDLIQDLVAKVGENIQINSFSRLQI
jgi:elongation factor Ts